MKGYKAFNPGWICRDFQYELGKIYELPEGEELKMCSSGFHFCRNPIDVFGYYDMTDDVLIAEVEALGEIQQEGTKYCTNKIHIIKEFTRKQLQALILGGKYNTGNDNSGDRNSGNCNSGNSNSGDSNSGDRNSGNLNSGDSNSGNRNSGDSNSGDWNSGDRNSGHCNSGDWNSGDSNSGHWNSGDLNSGDTNSGNSNSGDWNSGDRNSGHWNSGDCNSGDWNSGHWNSGDRNSGIFNTDEPKMRAFNKETDITMTEFLKGINYDFRGLCERIESKALNDEDYDRIKTLPNFDKDIFKEITGIDMRGKE